MSEWLANYGGVNLLDNFSTAEKFTTLPTCHPAGGRAMPTAMTWAWSASRLKIWPNPAGDLLWVELPGPETASEPLELRVFDTAGKLILEKWLAADGEMLDLTSLPPGVFALKFVDGEWVFFGKFVRQ